MEEAIKLTYQGLRSRRPLCPAVKALAEARERAADPKRRYYGERSPAGLGAPMADGGQWAEYPESLGLRFLAWANELGGRYSRVVDNLGWFLYPEGDPDEVVRACVYMLPGKDGRTRYVPAFREGSTNRAGDWQDMSGNDSAVLYLRDIKLGERGGAGSSPASSDTEDAARDAASYADNRAEHYAERAREYQEAYAAGQRCESLIEEAQAERRDFLKLRAAIKAMQPESRAAAEPICTALQSALLGHLHGWRDAKAKAAELREEWSGLGAWRSHLEAAFREGMGA